METAGVKLEKEMVISEYDVHGNFVSGKIEKFLSQTVILVNDTERFLIPKNTLKEKGYQLPPVEKNKPGNDFIQKQTKTAVHS